MHKIQRQVSKMVEMQVFQAAKQMQNFIYLVGDAKTRSAWLSMRVGMWKVSSSL